MANPNLFYNSDSSIIQNNAQVPGSFNTGIPRPDVSDVQAAMLKRAADVSIHPTTLGTAAADMKISRTGELDTSTSFPMHYDPSTGSSVSGLENLSLSGLDTLRLPSGANFSGFSTPLPGKELEAVKARPALSERTGAASGGGSAGSFDERALPGSSSGSGLLGRTESMMEELSPADNEETTKKEKAVKVKKIFLRILRKVMEIPNESPLLLVWREGRIARKTGRQYPPGWYGIEVMDVEEVDAVIRKLVPELEPASVGMQDWTHSLARVLNTTPEAVKRYVILKNCRYRLNKTALSEATRERVQQVKMTMQAMHRQAQRDAATSARALPLRDTPTHVTSHQGGVALEQSTFPPASSLHRPPPPHALRPPTSISAGSQAAAAASTSRAGAGAGTAAGEGLSSPLTSLRRTLVGSLEESFQRMWQMVIHMDPATLKALSYQVNGLLHVGSATPLVSLQLSQQQQPQHQQQMQQQHQYHQHHQQQQQMQQHPHQNGAPHPSFLPVSGLRLSAPVRAPVNSNTHGFPNSIVS